MCVYQPAKAKTMPKKKKKERSQKQYRIYHVLTRTVVTVLSHLRRIVSLRTLLCNLFFSRAQASNKLLDCRPACPAPPANGQVSENHRRESKRAASPGRCRIEVLAPRDGLPHHCQLFSVLLVRLILTRPVPSRLRFDVTRMGWPVIDFGTSRPELPGYPSGRYLGTCCWLLAQIPCTQVPKYVLWYYSTKGPVHQGHPSKTSFPGAAPSQLQEQRPNGGQGGH